MIEPVGWSLIPLDADAAAEVAGWRYAGQYGTYDVGEPLDPASTMVVRDGTGGLIGYVVVGGGARVSGQEADPDVVDLGVGMAPSLMRTGLGHAFASIALAHARRLAAESGCTRIRVTILEWNGASLAVAARGGFVPVAEVINEEGRFVVLESKVTA